MADERTLTIRRIKTISVFQIVAAGTFCSLIPFALLMGVFALFGANTVSWNARPIKGIAGLFASPLVGVFIAAIFTAIGGGGLAFGLWLYSKLRPLKLRVIEERPQSPG